MTGTRRLGQGIRRARTHTAKDGTKSYLWRVTWGPEKGQNEARSFARDGDGKAWAIRRLAEVQRGIGTSPERRTATVTDAYHRWMETHRGVPLTLRNHETTWRLHIEPTWGKVRLRDLETERHRLRVWVREQHDRWAPGTARRHIDVLRAIFAYAVDDNLLGGNPLAKSRKLIEPRVQEVEVVVPTLAEVEAIIGGLGPDLSILAVLGAGLGLRYSEAAGLRVADVDFFRREVHIVKQVQRSAHGAGWSFVDLKTASPRHIEMDDFVLGPLGDHLARRPAREPYGLIASTRVGTPIFPPRFAGQWAQARRRLGLRESFTFHGLRHWHASLMLAERYSYREVAARLGDTEQTVMKTYSHVLRDDQRTRRGFIDAAISQSRAHQPHTSPFTRP